jgi:1,4-alpha-glucan branching enzyme
MPFPIEIHYDNRPGFRRPHLWIWYEGSPIPDKCEPRGEDSFGFVYDCSVEQPEFSFKFQEGEKRLGTARPWEGPCTDRCYRPLEQSADSIFPNKIWCRGNKAFVYRVEPRKPEHDSAETYLHKLRSETGFKPGIYVPETGGLSGLGANLLKDGRVLFGFYHPNAARVYLTGDFNDWQSPGHKQPDENKFIELKLYEGYFDLPNIWLVVVDQARVGEEYKFFVRGGGAPPEFQEGDVQEGDVVPGFRDYYCTDPYARRLRGDDNHSVVVDPTSFRWSDESWSTPERNELILYEMSVPVFTNGDAGIGIQERNQGKFKGVTERIGRGYFDRLGVTALSLMPVAEWSSEKGPEALGCYNPSLFFAIERDYGPPDDLRELVDTAHKRGLAVLLDQVFSHTSNDLNPLWKMILEHPDEGRDQKEGGLYFSGTTPWGNRVATEKPDVQNMLIDACKLFLEEYHVDGFRFDATYHHHDGYMDYRFLVRLAKELKAFKPDVLLVAENVPNQADLNRLDYAQWCVRYAQWCVQFRDKIKELLKEEHFDQRDHLERHYLGNIFYFSKRNHEHDPPKGVGNFADHTDNVVNYCYSHDENSIAQELNDNPEAKNRKGRLGLFATMVALGQPMIHMGQEFNNEKGEGVTLDWPRDLESDNFFLWASRLIRLRRRYPGLKLRGDDPKGEGQFEWILRPRVKPEREDENEVEKVIGWKSRPTQFDWDTLVVMLNFEKREVPVDVNFGIPGTWLQLADIDEVNDIPPEGTNSVQDPTALRTDSKGRVRGLKLPAWGGRIYKWEDSSR